MSQFRTQASVLHTGVHFQLEALPYIYLQLLYTSTMTLFLKTKTKKSPFNTILKKKKILLSKQQFNSIETVLFYLGTSNSEKSTASLLHQMNKTWHFTLFRRNKQQSQNSPNLSRPLVLRDRNLFPAPRSPANWLTFMWEEPWTGRSPWYLGRSY